MSTGDALLILAVVALPLLAFVVAAEIDRRRRSRPPTNRFDRW